MYSNEALTESHWEGEEYAVPKDPKLNWTILNLRLFPLISTAKVSNAQVFVI